MNQDTFKPFVQELVNAARSADPEAAKARAAVAVNSVGTMVQPKRGERSTAFSTAVDTLGDAIQAARGAKLARTGNKKEAGTEQPAKSLAELLAESAQESE